MGKRNGKGVGNGKFLTKMRFFCLTKLVTCGSRVDIWLVLAQVLDGGSVILFFFGFRDRNSQTRLQLVRKPPTPAAGMSAAVTYATKEKMRMIAPHSVYDIFKHIGTKYSDSFNLVNYTYSIVWAFI